MFLAAFYRGTRPGLAGIYNYLVRKRGRGPYSHCELVFSDGLSASASFTDGGVRFKHIEYDSSRWDFIVLPDELEDAARAYFEARQGWGYDLMGNLHLTFGFVEHSAKKLFCSEADAEALGIPEAWRFEPNALAAVLRWRYQQA